MISGPTLIALRKVHEMAKEVGETKLELLNRLRFPYVCSKALVTLHAAMNFLNFFTVQSQTPLLQISSLIGQGVIAPTLAYLEKDLLNAIEYIMNGYSMSRAKLVYLDDIKRSELASVLFSYIMWREQQGPRLDFPAFLKHLKQGCKYNELRTIVAMGADAKDSYITFFENIDSGENLQQVQPFSLKWLAAKAASKASDKRKRDPVMTVELNETIQSARKYARAK